MSPKNFSNQIYGAGISGQSNVSGGVVRLRGSQQYHYGSGDNIAGDKNINYDIKAEVAQIIEHNQGQVIAKQYAAEPQFAAAVAEMTEILKNLQQKYPNATPAKAEVILEAKLEEIKVDHPGQWQLLRRQLLNRERWFNGGKAALSEVAKHYVEGNVFYKAGLAFLEGFSEDENEEI